MAAPKAALARFGKFGRFQGFGMKSTPKVVPGAAPAMAEAGVGGYDLYGNMMIN